MEETVIAQREQILLDWRNHLSLDEFRLLVSQIDSLIELVREEIKYEKESSGKCENCGNNCWKLVCETCGEE